MRRCNWLKRGIVGALTGLSLTVSAWGQIPSENTAQSFTPSVVVNASANTPSMWQRFLSWLPFGSSTPAAPPPTQMTRAGQTPGGYNGLNPGELMGTRPLRGTPVGTYRPIQ
jgi:hypothetical protein